jgi:cell division protein FtsW (lipid II flippase)
MKTPTHHSRGRRLERAMIAFFILAALSLLVVYGASPAIYAHSLALTSSPTDRYPVPVTLFLIGILTMIALLILGVMRHWYWLFWLMLAAFASSALQIPVTFLQMTGMLPSPDPLWYSLFRMGVAVVELALAVWMIHIYRREGVWAQGAKRNER